jgi:Xaa-Pro aminopeptidase
VLIDAGCELDGYAADITRTFPVNGRFSGPQRDVYEIVLAAQAAAIAADQTRRAVHPPTTTPPCACWCRA